MAILEAMACRVPVIVSESCHFPEIAEVGAGQVVPLQVDAIADAILSTINDVRSATAMGQAGRGLVEDRFTWKRVAVQTIEMYRAFHKAAGAR